MGFRQIAVCAIFAALAACDDSGGSSAPSSSAGAASAPAAATVVAAPSNVSLSASTFTAAASARTAVVTVERTGASQGTTSIGFTTSNGSAVGDSDYNETAGVLTWSKGDTSVKKIFVPFNASAAGKSFQISLLQSGGSANLAAPATATVMIIAPASNAPPAAAGVGYNTQTFGPALTMGANWYDFNFYGTSGQGGTQTSDGAVIVSGQGAGQISSATLDQSKPGQWKGTAFGGGAYFEAVFSFTNAGTAKVARWPAFWASDIENMSANSVTQQTQWLGQPSGYGDWIETDFFEYDRQNVGEYGVQIHNWYGFHDPQQVQDVRAYTGGVKVPAGFQWSQAHKYGYLWVPATSTMQGYAKVFLDDVEVGPTVYWDQHDPQSPPAPVVGSSAFSVLDTRHLALIIDTGAQNPMTIESVSVWQAAAGNNLTQ